MTMQSLRPFILATYELTRDAKSATQQGYVNIHQSNVNQAVRGMQ